MSYKFKNGHSLAVLKATVQEPNTISSSNAVCKCGNHQYCRKGRYNNANMQTATRMNNKHCNQKYEFLLHSCLIQVTYIILYIAIKCTTHIICIYIRIIPYACWLTYIHTHLDRIILLTHYHLHVQTIFIVT